MKDFNKIINNSVNYQAQQKAKLKITKIPIYLIFQIFFLLLFMFFLIFQNIRYKSVESKIYELVKEKRKLAEEILPIKLEIRNLTRNEVLEKLAEEKFNLKKPKKEQIIKIEYIE